VLQISWSARYDNAQMIELFFLCWYRLDTDQR
jgi:hypothetical protein